MALPRNKKNIKPADQEPEGKPARKLSWIGRLFWILQLRDGTWSFPLAITLCYFFGVGLLKLFGWGTGLYDMSFFQPAIMAGGIVVAGMNVANLGLYFNNRGYHRWYFGFRNKEKTIFFNPSKDDWKLLTPWQRFLLFHGTSLFYLLAYIVVYIMLV